MTKRRLVFKCNFKLNVRNKIEWGISFSEPVWFLSEHNRLLWVSVRQTGTIDHCCFPPYTYFFLDESFYAISSGNKVHYEYFIGRFTHKTISSKTHTNRIHVDTRGAWRPHWVQWGDYKSCIGKRQRLVRNSHELLIPQLLLLRCNDIVG